MTRIRNRDEIADTPHAMPVVSGGYRTCDCYLSMGPWQPLAQHFLWTNWQCQSYFITSFFGGKIAGKQESCLRD